MNKAVFKNRRSIIVTILIPQQQWFFNPCDVCVRDTGGKRGGGEDIQTIMSPFDNTHTFSLAHTFIVVINRG